MAKRLLMISTDRKIFEEGSPVRARQAEYAKSFDEVHIIVFAGRSFSEQVISANCWAYPTRSWSKLFYPFDAMRLGRFIIEKKDITDITCQDASLTAMAGVSLKKSAARIGKDIPIEIQVHEDIGAPNYPFNITNKIRKALALSYLPKADSIRVVSNRIKEYLIKSLDITDSKISVRPIFVDTEAIRNASVIEGADLHKKYPQFDKIILMAGRLEQEKNVGLALEAFILIREKSPQAGLIIVGTGSQLDPLKKISRLPGIMDTIVFEGWADQKTLCSYYKTADIFLNTSLFEGYGMALVEAHAAGCKIVSTDVGVAGEVGATIVDWNPRSIADGIFGALGV